MTPHVHRVQIYYEDTDVSGVVYHANYFRYFERAREHLLGVEELVRLLDAEGVGFVVYKCEATFREGARLGDTLEIRTVAKLESDYRVVFQQDVYRPGGTAPLVLGVVHLVCVNATQQLVPLPPSVVTRLRAHAEGR
jgi:acyl-CoA thioester hydrolase